MTVALQIGLIFASVGGLLAVMAVVHALARRYGWRAETQRKAVHVVTGLYALTLPLTFSETWPVLLLTLVAVVVLGVMRLPALARSGLGSTIHGVERKSYGEILLAIAVGFLFFRSAGAPVLFVLPILVLTFSDAAAAMTGVRYGRRLFPVEDGTKSLEGVVMFFLVTLILSMVTLLLMTDIPRQSVILISLLVAAFGAQIEAQSWRGFDNFFVPVGVHLFLENNLATPPAGLLAEAVAFIAFLAALYAAAPSLGLSRNAAQGYGVLAFLILSVTAPHNAILPLAAFAAFLLARQIRPCRSPYPDLDALAMMTGVAVFWLFAGEWSGHSAINLYNLTFAGAAAGFAMLAGWSRSIAVAAVVPGLALVVLAITPFNAAAESGREITALAVGTSLALPALVAALWPHLFDRWRAPRLFGLALLGPIILFLTRWIGP